jgi:shikimate dehydrogenase
MLTFEPITMTTNTEQVEYVSGKTRLYGIVGDPIEQVRSPEMITAELVSRGVDAVLVPVHVLPHDFDACLPQLLRVRNLDGLVFTIPYKVRACALADELLAQARVVGAVNVLGRGSDDRWRGEIFDGLGCVEAFRRRGMTFAGKRVMLIGAGGAGSAIAVAVGFDRPASLRIHDVDGGRASALAAKVAAANPGVDVVAGAPVTEGVDFLLNASPVGMLDDARLPIAVTALPSGLIVFDAIVKPERTPLLALAERCGCTTVTGREMMRGQIARMVDFFVES